MLRRMETSRNRAAWLWWKYLVRVLSPTLCRRRRQVPERRCANRSKKTVRVVD